MPCVKYNEAVEEALCFGWIDSLVKRIDDEKYMQKFSQRKKNSKWSELNKLRVAALIKEGKMTKAGSQQWEAILKSDDKIKSSTEKRKIELTPEFEKAIRTNPKAWENFQNLAKSHQRNYILWISSVKRVETIQKRIKEAISLLEQNKKLGLK
jgi:uncharacterized protein YdeI (YjbR/CyaY-like superfamily)